MDSDRVRRQYHRFAEEECRGYSEHYFRLAHAIAEDEELLDFIAAQPVTQPNLLLASLQYLTGAEGMPRDGAEVRTLIRDRGHEVAELMQSRRTQTNEPGRCAVLLPSLPPGPLALLEVGASAGLCLLLDSFFYDYGSTQLGPRSSRVRLSCEIEGPVPLPSEIPRVVWRAGLDLNPVDVESATDVRWLLSCVWPDQPRRRERLVAAIDIAQQNKPKLYRGDLVSALPAVLADVPSDAQLVVFHSAVLGYVRREDRNAFAAVLRDTSRQRDVVWISNEAPGVVPGIATPAPRDAPLEFLLSRSRLSDGRRSDEVLAVAHPHGAALRWMKP